MREKLILTGVALLLLASCASVRRATPLAVEEVRTYPVTGEKAEAPVKEEADAPDYSPQAAASAQKEEPGKPEEEMKLSAQVIAYARTFTGTPYKLGASGPKQFDCSNFTSYVFRHFGYNITAFSQAQFQEGREVASYSDLQPGDLVFFGKRGKVRDIGHVGIVVSVNEENGSFNFIHASVSKGVTEENSNHPYFMMRYMGARRILPDE